MQGVSPWKLTTAQPLITANMKENEDTTRMLLTINQNILDMKEYTHRINEKLHGINERVNQTALDVELHQETLIKQLPILVSIITDFLWPMTNYNVAGLKENQPKLQKILTKLETSLSYLKSDYTTRRKRSTSPLPHLSPSQEPTKASNKGLNNESIQNMSS
ncbi:unnamed protein product [Rotaria sp. Silwood1]|nr:unnamed protein product [Rotaria sp. Silwood1]CAF4846752.1 unnamed protein product [Rotaria sp. Silwood1]CAF4913153.1 unnamed protein product [Rotaria sp. Silwood1]